MSRTSTPPKTPVPMPEGNEEALTRASSASRELATAAIEQSRAVRAVAARLKYEGSLSPDALENGARDAIRRINLGVFELGGYLLMLRDACPYSEFLPALQRLELEPRVAQQYMQVTARFANTNSNSFLKQLGKTKLLEMLILDDEQVEELQLTGQTGELKLDKIAAMSVKELRAALREERKERQADADVLKRKAERIEELERENLRIAKMEPDEALLTVKKEAASFYNDAHGLIVGQLRKALKALNESGAEVVYMAGLVGQLKADLDTLRQEFDLPDLSNAADQKLADEVSQWASN